MKSQYSYSDCWDYFRKLFKNYPENVSSTRLDEIKKDIVSLCSPFVEEFWADFYLEKLSYCHYRWICKSIRSYFLRKEPIAYLLGKCYFRDLVLDIKRGVLIPQSDTECLVDNAIFLIRDLWGADESLKILEIGTGSGNISLSLAKECSNWELIATDINLKALRLSKHNAQKLSIKNVKFLFSDVFEKVQGEFDVIVSNPPYISDADYFLIDSYATKQPRDALIAKNDGYFFYQEIISKCEYFLKDKFLVIFEIGNNQADNIIKLVLNKFSDVKVNVFKDFRGNERVISFYRY